MSNNIQSNYLFILVAASAVGKGTLVNKLCEEGSWNKAKKYSTRDYRKTDNPLEIDDIIPFDEEEIDNLKGYNLADKKKREEVRQNRMNRLIEICGDKKGIVYYRNGNIYGISIDEIVKGLEKSHLAIVISDFKVIEELKKKDELQSCIKVMYLASTIDERELLKRYKARQKTELPDAEKTIKTIRQIQNMSSILLSAGRLKYLTKIEETLPLLNEEWNQYVPYFDTIKTRATNIRMLYNRYIDNITSIDYVILNFYGLEYMFKQARNILKNVKSERKKPDSPIFMVCAAKSSGKATLMEIIGDIGKVHGNIEITTKYTNRESQPHTDGRDGMIAFGEEEGMNFRTKMEQCLKHPISESDIWKWSFKGRPHSYAVCHREIDNNKKSKKAQIFISNMGEIKYARDKYEKDIIVLYLHATHATETQKHIEEKRLRELAKKRSEITKKDYSRYQIDKLKEEFKDDKTIQNELKLLVKKDKREIISTHRDFRFHNINIDHVLLNTGTREDLIEQMTNLIDFYSSYKIVNFKEINDLIKCLKRTIDISKWGKNGYKSIENLWEEIKNKDCVISENVIRQISIAVINIEKDKHVLIESSQKLKDGFVRNRNKLPREKIKEGETILNASIRCLKEELNLEEIRFEITNIVNNPKIYTKESASYPGLKTEYIQYDVYVQADLPFSDFSTKESGEIHDPVDVHFWKWQKME